MSSINKIGKSTVPRTAICTSDAHSITVRGEDLCGGLIGTNFPLRALRGVPILARTAGLIAHLAEEAVNPSGFALSYQATRELVYEGKPAPVREGDQ